MQTIEIMLKEPIKCKNKSKDSLGPKPVNLKHSLRKTLVEFYSCITSSQQLAF